jgi:hypothetical protein
MSGFPMPPAVKLCCYTQFILITYKLLYHIINGLIRLIRIRVFCIDFISNFLVPGAEITHLIKE